MIKIVIAINFLLALAIGVWFSVSRPKLAYINNGKLVLEYIPMKNLKQESERKVKALMANVDTLAAEFQRQLRKYEQEREKMSEKERSLSEEVLNSKRQQYINYRRYLKTCVHYWQRKQRQVAYNIFLLRAKR